MHLAAASAQRLAFLERRSYSMDRICRQPHTAMQHSLQNQLGFLHNKYECQLAAQAQTGSVRYALQQQSHAYEITNLNNTHNAQMQRHARQSQVEQDRDVKAATASRDSRFEQDLKVSNTALAAVTKKWLSTTVELASRRKLIDRELTKENRDILKVTKGSLITHCQAMGLPAKTKARTQGSSCGACYFSICPQPCLQASWRCHISTEGRTDHSL